MIGLLGLIWLGLLYAERAKTEPTRSAYLRGAVIAKVRHYVGGVMIGLGVALATFKFERNGARENHHRHE